MTVLCSSDTRCPLKLEKVCGVTERTLDCHTVYMGYLLGIYKSPAQLLPTSRTHWSTTMFGVCSVVSALSCLKYIEALPRATAAARRPPAPLTGAARSRASLLFLKSCDRLVEGAK